MTVSQKVFSYREALPFHARLDAVSLRGVKLAARLGDALIPADARNLVHGLVGLFKQRERVCVCGCVGVGVYGRGRRIELVCEEYRHKDRGTRGDTETYLSTVLFLVQKTLEILHLRITEFTIQIVRHFACNSLLTLPNTVSWFSTWNSHTQKGQPTH